MTKITIEIHNEDDRHLLEELLRKMNIVYTAAEESPETLLSIIEQGGDGKSIADPSSWQEEIRQDCSLPFQE